MRLPKRPQNHKFGGRAKNLGYWMKRKGEPRTRSAHKIKAPSPDISILLDEIEKEPVPERLLELALKLQQRLSESRCRDEAEEAPLEETGKVRVRQSP